MDYKILLAGLIPVIIGAVSYVIYIRGMFMNKTQPHAFSWLVWGVVTGIAFAGQVVDGGGAGSWNTGFTSFMMFVISGIAVSRFGIGYVTRFDWYSFVAALLAIVPWLILSDPLISIILVAIIDTAGFLPSFRKAYVQPYEDSATVFILSAIKFGIAIFALENYSLITLLFPVMLVITNSAFVLLLVIRRLQLRKNA